MLKLDETIIFFIIVIVIVIVFAVYQGQGDIFGIVLTNESIHDTVVIDTPDNILNFHLIWFTGQGTVDNKKWYTSVEVVRIDF